MVKFEFFIRRNFLHFNWLTARWTQIPTVLDVLLSVECNARFVEPLVAFVACNHETELRLLANAIELFFRSEQAHVDDDIVRAAEATLTRLANRNPTRHRKVHGFGDVESCVESSVIGERKGDHELAGMLDTAIDRNAIAQLSRIEHGELVTQKLIAFRSVLGKHLRDVRLRSALACAAVMR